MKLIMENWKSYTNENLSPSFSPRMLAALAQDAMEYFAENSETPPGDITLETMAGFGSEVPPADPTTLGSITLSQLFSEDDLHNIQQSAVEYASDAEPHKEPANIEVGRYKFPAGEDAEEY
jgi:hypothetical protein